MFNHHHPQNVTTDDVEPGFRFLTTLETTDGFRALIVKYLPGARYPFTLLDVPAFEDPNKTRDAILVGDGFDDLGAVWRTALGYTAAMLSGGAYQPCCPTCSGGAAVLP